MTKRLLLPLACLAGFALPLSAQDAPPKGFVPLFNGKDLEGWFGHGTKDPRTLWAMSPEDLAAHKKKTLEDVNAHWSVKDGVLVNDGKGLYLTTDKDYRDFELMLEYKTVPKADSGIYLRGIPQVQIWDFTEKGKFKLGADKGSGGLWNNSKGNGKDPLELADNPLGEWNKFRVRMVGERVDVHLNGKHIVKNASLENFFEKKKGPAEKAPAFPVGPIQLQTHGGEISWKNVWVKEIGSEEANDILRELSGDEGFESLFNGKDLEGWKGSLDNYDVVDGNIRCKQGKGGNLLHTTEYGDVHLRFEFRLPPGGNNGIALRVPAEGGNPANAGLEVQVLDDTHPKYANLKPYQFHGSVYTLAPAKPVRNVGRQKGDPAENAAPHSTHLRPVGEWNYEEIIYKGSHIQVILNGTKIVDMDLAKVDAPKHKGKQRTSGFLGFAGHNDPVEFRKISAKKL